MQSPTVEAREARLRRALHREGLALSKSRRQWTEGTYGVINPSINGWVLTGPNGWGFTIKAVEEWLDDWMTSPD